MKKIGLLFFCVFSTLFIDNCVLAEEITITDNDYQLTCIYKDGSELTITRDDIYFYNTSASVNSTSASGIKFFIASDQENNYQEVTEDGKCPSKLYAYMLPSKYDDSSDSDSDKVYTIYYSTKNGIAAEVGGGTHGCGFFWLGNCTNATQQNDLTTTLISEEVYLTTKKTTTVCDYEASSDNANTTSQVASIYLFDNLTVVDANGYTSFLETDSPRTTCTGQLAGETSGKVYINDPTAKSVSSGIASTYNYKRYYISSGSDSSTLTTAKALCSNYNDGNVCLAYEYIGERNGSYDDLSDEGSVCDVLGSATITQIKRIISILQMLVPVLLIVLTGLDIAKIVFSGNLEEELPKKKRTIVARFIIACFFFFLPLITNLLLDMLEDAGVLGVESIECITEE